MSRAWLEARGLDLDTLEGRPLVRGLRLAIGDDRVAVVGRNGAGKSALLDALVSGPGVTRRGRIVYLTQDGACLGAAPVSDARAWAREAAWAGLSGRAEPPSPGERRKRQLITAILSGADILVLDEPTEDLDPRGVDWLIARLGSWRGGLVVVSHDPRLLSCFHDFFVVSESGCRHVAGALDEVEAQIAAEQRAAELRYAGGLSHLVQRAQDDLHIRRRRARKRALGRLHELARCTPRSRLNGKRGRAQVSQARVAGVRDDRITLIQGWARAARRALAVELPLRLAPPELGAPTSAAIVLEAARVARGGRELVARVDLTLGDGRIGVVGANGAGKSSLLAVLAGELAPAGGLARVARDRIGWIDQGAEAWRVDDRLADRIADARGRDEVARVLAAHRMPLALALRPMRSLSPGERARAALICLYARRPAPEVLLLDEPTRGLDRTGAAALAEALRAWPGGLVVASHDRPSLDALRLSRVIDLDRS